MGYCLNSYTNRAKRTPAKNESEQIEPQPKDLPLLNGIWRAELSIRSLFEEYRGMGREQNGN